MLGLFRIALGAVGMWFALSTFHFIDFTWYSRSAEFREWIVMAHWLWVVLCILLVLGIGGRIIPLAHFIVICAILNGDDLGSTVNADLYLIASFWAIFPRTDGALSCRSFLPWTFARHTSVPPPKAWPMLLMGVNDGIFILTAGLTKFYDPWWYRGFGFYQTLSLPWIKAPEAALLLNYKFIMQAVNWIAIVFELCFLFLFLIPRTRWLACVLLAGFFAQLIYPIRIDFIGEFGMTHVLALAAVTPSLSMGFRRLVRWKERTEGSLSGNSSIESFRRPWLMPAGNRALAMFFAGYVGVHSMFALLAIRYDPIYDYPPVSVAEEEPEEDPQSYLLASAKMSQLERWRYEIHDQVRWVSETPIYPPLKELNDNATNIVPKSLFSAGHFFGIYEYRVVVTLRDGTTREPVIVFNEDMTPGPYSAGWGTPRYLQRCMYEVSLACHTLAARPNEPVREDWTFVMNNLINFSITKLPKSEQEQIVKVGLLTSPIVVPIEFEGDARPWLEYPWTTIYEFDATTQSYRYVDPPTPFPYKLRSYY